MGRPSMKHTEQARVLLAKALDDEKAAVALLAHTEISDSVIGFHCQQAAEKLLKALLSVRRVVFRHQHDLSALIEVLEHSGYKIPDGLHALESLTPFAVQFRYELVETHEHFDRQAALQLVTGLRALVESEIERSSS